MNPTTQAAELRAAADELPDMAAVMDGLGKMLECYPGLMREYADALDLIGVMKAREEEMKALLYRATNGVWRPGDLDKALAVLGDAP